MLIAFKADVDEVKTKDEVAAESLQAAKDGAKAELASYVEANEYSEANAAIVNGYVNEYSTLIDNAETIEAINAFVAEAKGKIDEVKTLAEEEAEAAAKALAEAKLEAKAELEAYAAEGDYSVEKQGVIDAYVYASNKAVESASSIEAVNALVVEVKAKIDAVASEVAGEYTAEVYKDISEFWTLVSSGTYDPAFINGKVLPDSTIHGATFISSALASNNGIEFKMTMAESEWASIPGMDSTWAGGSWDTPAVTEQAIQFTVAGFQELILYKNAAGKLAINSKSWRDGTIKTAVLDDCTLAGEHTYRYVNVAGVAGGSETRLYIDGVLVFKHSTAGALKGSHFLVWNFSGKEVTIKTAIDEVGDVYTDAYDYFGNSDLLTGMTVAPNNGLGKAWIENALKTDNGSEVKITVNNWDDWTLNDANYCLYFSNEGFNQINLYKTENGVGVYCKYWKGDALAYQTELAGMSLAGEHTYKVVHEATGFGARVKLYIDGNLVCVGSTTATMSSFGGYHCYITNKTSADVVMKSAKSDAELVAIYAVSQKAAAAEYAAMNEYYANEQAEIDALLAAFNAAVDTAENIQAVDALLIAFKADVDDVVTKSEIDAIAAAEVLANAKETAIAELASYVNTSDYSEANIAIINGYVSEYTTTIENAESIEAVNVVLAEVKGKIDEVKTLAEEAAEVLANAKETAIAELASYVITSDYSEANIAIINGYVSEYTTTIENAESIEAVNVVLAEVKGKIDEVKTLAEEEAEALVAAKDEATAELAAYINAEDYAEDNLAIVNRYVSAYTALIAKAETVEAVNELLVEAKGKIDLVEKNALVGGDDSSDDTTSSDDTNSSDAGIFGVLGCNSMVGLSVPIAAAGVAVLALLKKKDEE